MLLVRPLRICWNLKAIGVKEYKPNTFVLFAQEYKLEEPEHESEIKVINVISSITNPVLLSKVEFNYPNRAIQEEMQGTVHLSLLVSKKGKVIKAKIDSSSGHKLLDNAAMMNSKKLLFSPAYSNGKAIQVWSKMEFKFYFERNNKNSLKDTAFIYQ